MVFSRAAAAVVVALLIALGSLAAIALVKGAGPILVHGQNVQNSHGVVQYFEDTQVLGPDQQLRLKTGDGQQQVFLCRQRCLNQLGHIQRHINEKAPTDVYYIRQANNVLVAIDVD